ncbi:hypothetical protein DFH09DRAFT_1364770 [Mycena vulgaris]|nr:hypothetical protein DFH09DRAFT_1364770 [Mycena vulgaris]
MSYARMQAHEKEEYLIYRLHDLPLLLLSDSVLARDFVRSVRDTPSSPMLDRVVSYAPLHAAHRYVESSALLKNPSEFHPVLIGYIKRMLPVGPDGSTVVQVGFPYYESRIMDTAVINQLNFLRSIKESESVRAFEIWQGAGAHFTLSSPAPTMATPPRRNFTDSLALWADNAHRAAQTQPRSNRLPADRYGTPAIIGEVDNIHYPVELPVMLISVKPPTVNDILAELFQQQVSEMHDIVAEYSLPTNIAAERALVYSSPETFDDDNVDPTAFLDNVNHYMPTVEDNPHPASSPSIRSSLAHLYVDEASQGNPLQICDAEPGDLLLFYASLGPDTGNIPMHAAHVDRYAVRHIRNLMSSRSPTPTPAPTGPNQILGSSPERPVRLHPINSQVYAARADAYDLYAGKIAALGADALANIDYGDGFVRVVEGWSSNYKYVDKDGNELRTTFIAEVMGPAAGTLLRAHGNYYARDGDNFKPVDDRAKIKDTLALGIPTLATVKMYNTCMNQLNSLGQVVDADADEDQRKGNSPFVRSWTRCSRPDGVEHDTIIAHMMPKYAIPSAAGAPKVKRTPKRKTDAIDAPAADADIKLGAHYEPSLLPDYGGPYFNHVKAKLVQLDVRDKNNQLIPPWKFYDALKPGTLVLVMATLHCFLMQDDSGKEKKERKIYQINAHSIKVLDEADGVAEERTRPIPPTGAERVVASLPARASATLSAFDAFGSSSSQGTAGALDSNESSSGAESAPDSIADPDDAPADGPQGKSSSKAKGKRARRD